MTRDVPVKCACGKLRGTAEGISPTGGCRVVCYCKDCQAFAKFLGSPGITDEWGGSDLFQMAPGRLRLEQPDGALSCVRLSDKGMYRWYCGDCKSPVGNTLGPRVPFVGVLHSFFDIGPDRRALDDLLGKPLAAIKTESALGAVPPETKGSELNAILRAVKLVGTWWLTGAGQPSPFFDRTSIPKATPRVLTPDERNAL